MPGQTVRFADWLLWAGMGAVLGALLVPYVAGSTVGFDRLSGALVGAVLAGLMYRWEERSGDDAGATTPVVHW
jgi:uncharacterized membrane protein